MQIFSNLFPSITHLKLEILQAFQISFQNSKNLYQLVFNFIRYENRRDKEKFQGEIFINMRFSINSSQIFFHIDPRNDHFLCLSFSSKFFKRKIGRSDS